MRFNSKELSLLVQQTTHFDKEGYLLMKDKQEGLFKKSEAYIHRYIRLKGNLLFYFKNKDSKSEAIGVIILERCAVELDVEEEVPNGFLLVFEGEDHAFRFGASTEVLRDSWIQALHIASRECLKMQLQSLREQLQSKTGTDPYVLPSEPNSSVDFESHSESASEDPVLEISLACSNLPNDNTDTPPNALVVIHTILPPQQQMWMHHNHTEIVEKSNNPQFLKTIGFGDKYGIDTSTRVRLTVHHVVERMTGTMTQRGQAIFTLQDILHTPDLTLTLRLKTPEQKDGGAITVTMWVNDERVSIADLQAQQSGSYNKRPRSVSLGRHSHNLHTHFSNIIKRSFRFATNNEKSLIQVSEYMGESKWTFDLPIQLLRLWVHEEKQMISLLQDLGEIPFDQGYTRQETSDFCMSMVSIYTQHIAHLSEYRGVTFKASMDKDKEELQFIPINLHIERMVITSDACPAEKFYDITTVGSFSDHCRDMKYGGLKRLLHQLKTSYSLDVSGQPETKIQRACSLLNEVTELRSQLRGLCDKLNQTTSTEKLEGVTTIVACMKEKMARLNSLCGEPLIINAAESYLSAKRNANTSEGTDSASLTNMPEVGGQGLGAEKAWKWSGSNFVKSPTMEPWEVTRLNLEAAFVCLVSVVDELTRCKSKVLNSQLLGSEAPADQRSETSICEAIKSSLAKMQSFLEIVWARISVFLTFLFIMENKSQVKTLHDIRMRRDVTNAHSITTLVSAFLGLTQTEKMMDPQFLHQLSHVGLLFQVEGLLSCHSNELALLEDTIVAVDDLSHVTFRLVVAKDEDYKPRALLGSYIREGYTPDVNRHNIIIKIPLPQECFSRLPKELQLGKQISVTPVLFNIGINEKATLAERFGSTALQDKLNQDSFARMYDYYSKYSKYYDDPLDRSKGVGSLSHLVKLLQNNVMTKKSKNVDVLFTSEEVTRALKGLRVTFCKSGKDRTAMGVTLEMVHLLQRHHNLASHVFSQSLDCLRSVGCRRENTLKNTGVKKYAFISLQMLYIPKLYRAPSGTYGNTQT